MNRRKSTKVAERNEPILERIRALKSDHPFWGYRRIWAYLQYVDGLPVNQKRILRLMRENNLLVKPNMKIKASRIEKPKPRPSRPNEWWGIDMTKVLTTHEGWVYIVLVKDWYTKKIVGHFSGLQSKSWHWLLALNRAVNRQFPQGVKDEGLHLMSDNGCQPTSTSFMRTCSQLGVKQAFTSYNNPKGNADTERLMRTMKEELFWLREWESSKQIQEKLDEWVEFYNTKYLHSTLGYMPPARFEENFYQGQKIRLAHA
jgi:putative transposase